ncbi:MAG: DbpA RNA binding domain-containing protein [Gemmatimonadaceae bacterium]
MERERPVEAERELAGVARSQNALHLLPHDEGSIEAFLAPALAKVDSDARETQLLVLTPDPGMALAVARAAIRSEHGQSLRVIPLAGVKRAERLLHASPAPIVVGAPGEVLALIRAAALKLERLRVIVIAWADSIVDQGGAEALEAVMAEVPKEAARSIVAATTGPAVEELAERYARRARRSADVTPAPAAPVDIRYSTVASVSRTGTLRRLLDDLDPQVATIWVRSDDSERELKDFVRYLGHMHGDELVRIARGREPASPGLLVLYDLPADRSELNALLGAGAQAMDVVALVQPRQLPALRALAGGGRVTALSLAGPSALAHSREDAMRDELRVLLSAGVPAREMIALEPLLAEYDGVEIAAAALRLLERARERPATSPSTRGNVETERAIPTVAWTRLFITAGTRDGVTPVMLVGAITNEAGIAGSQVGKVEIRDGHSLVEVASSVADLVAAKLTGANIRGRRVIARLERDRAGGAGGGASSGPDRSRSGSGRPPRADGRNRPGQGQSDRPPRRNG